MPRLEFRVRFCGKARTFDVSGYEGGLQHATFRPQKYSYEYLNDPSLTQIG